MNEPIANIMCDRVKLLMMSGSAAACDFKRLLCPIKCWITQCSIVVTTVRWKTIVNLQSLHLLHITALPREDSRLQLQQLSTSESSSIHYVGVASLLAQTQAPSPDFKIYNSLPVVVHLNNVKMLVFLKNRWSQFLKRSTDELPFTWF